MASISANQIKDLLIKSWNEFNDDQAPRLGAALAYYTILSLAPLLILLIALAGLVFGKEAAEGQLFGEIRNMVGTQGAEAIQAMVASASKPASGVIASIVGFLTLLFGASSVTGELKASLNTIWDRPVQKVGIVGMAKERSKALGVVLGSGFLLLVSLAFSSVIAAAGKFFTDMLPIPEFVMSSLTLLVSLVVVAGVFAVLFKYLPDVKIQWGDVLIGAAFTSVLFTLGMFLIGMYLGKASFGSTYGAAGSLVIVLVWVYYSAQILFFGAEFTQVYAARYGSDPGKKRQRKGKRSQPAMPAPAEAETPGYADPIAAQSTSMNTATAATGTVLGSALAITKLVKLFRRSH